MSPQAVDLLKKNACAYDGSMTGQTIYAYVGGNPISRIDPNGLLWWGAHFSISYSAGRASGMGIFPSLSLAWNVMMVDKGTQGPDATDTVIHAMAGKKSNGEMQTECEAKEAADAYIKDHNIDPVRRIHSAQDRAAPWHYGQPWSKDLTIWDKAGHIWQDVFLRPRSWAGSVRCHR